MRPEDRKNWKIISITARREVSPRGTVTIRKAMQALVANETIDAIYFGGARGGDTAALRAAAKARKGRCPWFTVVVPDTEDSQPFAARQWFHLADEVVELGHPITKDDGFQAYHRRNEYLVDICTSLVAFFDGTETGGTWSTIQYAQSVGVLCHRIPV